eukprot:6081987-Pyramimonas_sp.AAC.1
MQHRCWKCPSNGVMQNTAVLATSHLCARAVAASPDSALWSRGLPPLASTWGIVPPPVTKVWSWGLFGAQQVIEG